MNSRKQRADWSIERASNQVQTILSSSRSAWSRSRRRRGRRPHGMLGIALKIQIIHAMARNALGTILSHESALPVPMLRQVYVEAPGR